MISVKWQKRIAVGLAIASFITGWLVEFKQLFAFQVRSNDALFLSQFIALLSALFAKHIDPKKPVYRRHKNLESGGR